MQNPNYLGSRWNRLRFGWLGVRWVLVKLNKLSRIHPHGGCQMPHFVLVFAYAQTSQPQLFPAPDGLGVLLVLNLSKWPSSRLLKNQEKDVDMRYVVSIVV